MGINGTYQEILGISGIYWELWELVGYIGSYWEWELEGCKGIIGVAGWCVVGPMYYIGI